MKKNLCLVLLSLVVSISASAEGGKDRETHQSWSGSCTHSDMPPTMLKGIASTQSAAIFGSTVDLTLSGAVVRNWLQGRSLVAVRRISQETCSYIFAATGAEPKTKLSLEEAKRDSHEVVKNLLSKNISVVAWKRSACVDDSISARTEATEMSQMIERGFRLVAVLSESHGLCTHIFALNL